MDASKSGDITHEAKKACVGALAMSGHSSYILPPAKLQFCDHLGFDAMQNAVTVIDGLRVRIKCALSPRARSALMF